MKLQTQFDDGSGETIVLELDTDHIDPALEDLVFMAKVEFSNNELYPANSPLFNIAGIDADGRFIIGSRYAIYSGHVFDQRPYFSLDGNVKEYVKQFGNKEDTVKITHIDSVDELRKEEWWLEEPFKSQFTNVQ